MVLTCASEKGLSSETQGPGVGPAPAEVDEQRGDGLGRHRGAAVGVHGVRDGAVAGDRLVEEGLGEHGVLPGGHDPPGGEPGVDVDQDPQVEPDPAGPVTGTYFAAYVMIDIYSRYIVNPVVEALAGGGGMFHLGEGASPSVPESPTRRLDGFVGGLGESVRVAVDDESGGLALPGATVGAEGSLVAEGRIYWGRLLIAAVVSVAMRPVIRASSGVMTRWGRTAARSVAGLEGARVCWWVGASTGCRLRVDQRPLRSVATSRDGLAGCAGLG